MYVELLKIALLDNRAFPPQRNPGIVVLPSQSAATGNTPAILDWVARTIGRSRDLWRGAKVVFSVDGSWVVHTFERDEGRIVSARHRLGGNGLDVWADDTVDPRGPKGR